MVALVGSLVSLVACVVSLVPGVVALVACVVSLVTGMIALVARVVPLVPGVIALVAGVVPLVGGHVPVVTGLVPVAVGVTPLVAAVSRFRLVGPVRAGAFYSAWTLRHDRQLSVCDRCKLAAAPPVPVPWTGRPLLDGDAVRFEAVLVPRELSLQVRCPKHPN